jgi:4-amino-4-deoxy-L-arabinose transferase and related glycosyltransferases of PMT family
MKTRSITYILLFILLILAFFLIFKNLSDNYLWQDEAESAVLAKSILHFGYPKAFDGLNILNPNIYSGFGNGYAWKYHPWLHFYLISLSYGVLGESAFSSRLPFALLGFLAIVIIFFLAKRLFKKDSIALLSVLLATTSVPFLLHIRQCRYYSLQMFLVLVIVWTYLNVLEKNWKYLWQLGALFAALCYTNHGTFIPVFGSVIVHFFLVNKNRDLRKNSSSCA